MVERLLHLKAEVNDDKLCSEMCPFLSSSHIFSQDDRISRQYRCSVFGEDLKSGRVDDELVIKRCKKCVDACAVPPPASKEPDGDGFVYDGIEGFVHDLGCTVRECVDCGCLVPGGPTRCKRCAGEVLALGEEKKGER